MELIIEMIIVLILTLFSTSINLYAIWKLKTDNKRDYEGTRYFLITLTIMLVFAAIVFECIWFTMLHGGTV